MNNGLVHTFSFEQGNFILRSPMTSREWQTYHDIRQTEIVNRYCSKDYLYNFNDPEEQMTTNYRFVLMDAYLSNEKVVGVIRVDLLKGQESSIRWVAIAPGNQRKGYGTIMLTLVEQFVLSQGRHLIRVPAEEESKVFYEKLGFLPMDWPDAPQHDSSLLLAKLITE